MKTLKDTFTTFKITTLIMDITSTIPECDVKRTESTIVVSAKGKKLLSAISPNGKVWSVQAHEKLFPAECYWSNEQ